MQAILLVTVALVVSVVGCSPIEAETKPGPKAPSASADSAAGDPADAPSEDSARPARKKTETAVFAGGCFWCTEFAFEQLTGVVDVESGYAGGTKETADYEWVHLGVTDHAEVIRVTYNPGQISYKDLLDVFFDAHDPTQLNRQGNDEGRQYRSAIFYANEEQEKQAQAKIDELTKKRVYKRRIVTTLEPLKEFYSAEDYHQDFATKNPEELYIQGHAVPKAMRVRKKHPELIRKGE